MEDFLCLRLHAATVDVAESGAVALALLSTHDYDTVISDIRMSDMDGLTLTTRILQVRPDIPTILVTAHGDRELGVQALNSGAYAYIQKPIDRDYLMAWVKRAIRMRRLAHHVDCQRRDLEKRAAELEEANQALQREIAHHEQAERHLRETEERFRLLVEGTKDYAIFMLDADGRVVSWNEGAHLMKGYRADEIIGECFSRFYTEDDRRAGRPQQLLKAARDRGHVEDEGWRVRRDGTRFWASVVIRALFQPDRQLRGYAKVTRDLTERRRMEEEIRNSLQQLEKCQPRSRS